MAIGRERATDVTPGAGLLRVGPGGRLSLSTAAILFEQSVT